MDAIETAIRNAFEKGNAEDRAFREKVYAAAFAALDRALQANPGVTVEAAINRRKAVKAKIAEIESEFVPAVADAAPEMREGVAPPVRPDAGDSGGAPAVQIDAPAPRRPDMSEPDDAAPPSARQEPPPVVLERYGGASAQPQAGVAPAVPDIMAERLLPGSPQRAATAAAEVTPDRDDRRARRRFPFGLALLIVLVALIGAGIWWAARTGLLRNFADFGGHSPATSSSTGQGATVPGGAAGGDQADAARDWIAVFAPSDATAVSAPAGTTAEVTQDDGNSLLRIRSGASGSAISFDVGQGVLEKLAGKHAVFDITARAEDGKDTQISVDCNFGELGDCGRKRYAVGQEKNEYLFDVDIPDRQPGAGGTIAINSDFDKQGKAVDIYQIRVSVAK